MISGHILHLDERSILPGDGSTNYVVHSKVRTYHKFNTVTSVLSVKTVLSGTERYRIDKVEYRLSGNEYLIVDQGRNLDIDFNEKQIAEGMCFYLDRKYFDQALTLVVEGESSSVDAPDNLLHVELVSAKYRPSDSSLGNFIQRVSHQIAHGNVDNLSEDFFLGLSLKLVDHQRKITGTINQVPGIKPSTRKELYQRAILARNYIEDNLWSERITLGKLASEAALSEVQLHRVFKKVFTTTPYQYVLNRKMDEAARILRAKSRSIGEVSELLGFPDTPTFSKLFKKTFGKSPSLFQSSN